MKYLSIFLFSIALIIISGKFAKAQQTLTKQQEKNLVAFAKIFGYMQYFHPSDEAQQIAWTRMAIRGCEQMLSVKDDAELIQELNKIFIPIGPSIKIFPTRSAFKFDMKDLLPPPTATNTRVVSWQHRGLYIDDSKSFSNIRLNRTLKEESNYLFLDNIDVSRFAGLPYEIVLSISGNTKSNSDFTFDITHRQDWDKNIFQRFAGHKITTQKEEFRFKGDINKAVKSLSVNIAMSPVFPVDLAIDMYVIVDGKRIPIPKTPAVANERGTINLTFSSKDFFASPIFKEQLELGDYVAKEVVEGISCIIPLALSGDISHTYPVGDTLKLKDLMARLEVGTKYRVNNVIDFPEIRLANIIDAWNVLNHSYAYWGSASVSPEAILRKALNDAYSLNSPTGFYKTLQMMASSLNDGHAFVTCMCNHPDSLSVPVNFGIVENKVVITKVLDNTLAGKVLAGDIVLTIDGTPAEKVLQERAALIAGSPQNKEFRALVQLVNGPGNKPVELKLRRKNKTYTIKLARTIKAESIRLGNQITEQLPNGWIKPGVYYFDMTSSSGTSFSADHYQVLSQAKAVIFDVRGYPNDEVYKLIPYLLKEPVEAKRMLALKILKPDLQDMIYDTLIERYSPAAQHLDSKMFFLTNTIAQSHAETFLGLIKDFKLGTIVGSPTSGANGNINTIRMLGSYSLSYSGVKVINNDGSKHHVLGIQPDVKVTPTLKSIRNKKDIVLETALKLAEVKN